MKNVNNISVDLFRVEDDITPFVEVDYMDKYAQEHHGIMILDSCSNYNFLCQQMYDGIGEMCRINEKTDNIKTVSGKSMSADNVHFSFALGGRQFSETFCIGNINLPSIKGCAPVIGMLGNVFFQKYGLAIDYSNFTLHTSNVSHDNLSIADCAFFFPMEIGFNNYGLPVLCMTQNNMQVVALADTGSTSNMFSAMALKGDGFRCKYLGTTDTIYGAAGSVEVKDAVMDFCLVTLNKEDTEDVRFSGEFKISPYYILNPKEGTLDENGQSLESVAAIISAPFMAKEGWILDFGANIIYKPKRLRRWCDTLSECVAV